MTNRPSGTLRECECVPGHRCDCHDLRSLLWRILTSAEYGKMEAEGLAADALGLAWDEGRDVYRETGQRSRVCGHSDPRSCDLNCRVLGIEATQADSVGRLRVLIDAEVRDRTRLLDRQAVDLRAEIVRLRAAIESFILWWDMPPYVLDDDDGLRMEVDELRAALSKSASTDQVTSK